MPALRSSRSMQDAESGAGPLPRRLLSLLLPPRRPSLALGVVVATALIVAETLMMYPLEQVAPATSLAVIYLLGIMVVAVLWGLRLAAAVSVASAAAFDYFHVPPVFDFTPARPEDTVALGIFVLVALLTGMLADIARSRAELAEHRQREADRAAERARVLALQQAALRRVATLVARGARPSEVYSAVADEIVNCLDVDTSGVWRYESDNAITLLAGASTAGAQYFPVGERLTIEGDNLGAMVLGSGRAARHRRFETDTGSAIARIRELGIREGVGAPIIVDGRVWGLAVAATTQPDPLPSDIEERIGDFADLVATALANAAANDELIASRARIVAAADDARRRIERDLHDGAQQRLVSLGLQLRLAEDSVPAELGDVREYLSSAVSGVAAVSSELQRISRGIHPAIQSVGGLGPALKLLAHHCPIPVHIDVLVERRLPDPVEVATYYVVAEALTNAAKHAHAARITVCVETTDATLLLSIQDDGIGGADARKGSGLIGLSDRVAAIGGQMRIASPAGRGTSLHITIPLGSK